MFFFILERNDSEFSCYVCKFVKMTKDSFFLFKTLVFTEASRLNYSAEKILGGHSQSAPGMADRKVIPSTVPVLSFSDVGFILKKTCRAKDSEKNQYAFGLCR